MIKRVWQHVFSHEQLQSRKCHVNQHDFINDVICLRKCKGEIETFFDEKKLNYVLFNVVEPLLLRSILPTIYEQFFVLKWFTQFLCTYHLFLYFSNLGSSNLRRSNLRMSNLRCSKLRRSNIIMSNLRSSNLRRLKKNFIRLSQ